MSPPVRHQPPAPRESDPLLVARTVLARYGLALLATVVTIIWRDALGALVHPNTVLAFLPAVWFSARQGGMGPGLFSTALSTVVGVWLFMPAAEPADELSALYLARVAIFVCCAVLVTWLTARHRTAVFRSGEALAAARDELEERVAARTAELAASNVQLREEIAHRAEAEEQFRNAFEHAPIGMALIGLEGEGLRANAALATMLGYEWSELRTLKLEDVQAPADRDAGLAQFRRLLDGEITTYRGIRHLRHRSGRHLPIQVSVSLVRDVNGRPLHAVSHLEDLTEQLEAERALRESEELFRSLAETSPIGISITQNDRFCFVNATSESNTGYSRAELLGMGWPDLMAPDQPIGELRQFVAQTKGHTTGVIRTELKIRTRDGQARWLDCFATPIVYRGAPALLSTGYDVTTRVRAEIAVRAARDELESVVAARTAALHESQARLQRLVNQLPAITYMIAVDGRDTPLFVSPQLETLMGVPAEAAMADPEMWRKMLHEDDRPRIEPQLDHLLATGEPFTGEHRLAGRDGQVRWFTHAAVMIRDLDGQPMCVEGILVDITARKQAELALEVVNQRMVETLDNMTEGFLVADNEAVLQYANPSTASMLGRSREALQGHNFFEVFPKARDTVFFDAYQRVRSERVAVEVEGYSPPFNRWFRGHMYPSGGAIAFLFHDSTDRHDREVTVMSDILGTLNRHLELDTALPEVGASMAGLTGCSFSAVCVFDEAREWGQCVTHSPSLPLPDGEIRFRLSESRAIPDIMAGRPFVERDVNGAPSDGAGRWLSALGLCSRLSLPLRGREDVIGMLILAWSEPDGIAPSLLPVLRQIADAVALAVEKHALLAQVRAGRARLAALSQRLLKVQEAERRHLARELHDEIGQALTGLRLRLDAAVHQTPEGMVGALSASQLDVERLLERVRNLSLDLRPTMLDDLGLLPALLWLVERYEGEASIRVRFEHRDIANRRFGSDVETAAYRIVQEGLTNVARHAGVRSVTVRAWAGASALGVQVVDAGVGFAAESDAEPRIATAGLSGMRERALLLGGDLVIESEPGRGTCISAELPLETPVSEETVWQST